MPCYLCEHWEPPTERVEVDGVLGHMMPIRTDGEESEFVPCSKAETSERPVKATRENLLGATLLCPHCNQLLRILCVSPRHVGFDPARGIVDGFFIITLSDGYCARMWETE